MVEPVILWVDDDLDDLEMFSQAAKEVCADTKLVLTHNGLEALAYLADAKASGNLPCLVVLDMNMPKLGGRETLVAIKKDPAYAHINVVIFTTSRSTLDKTFCDRFGAEMFTKPQSYDKLKDLISRFMGFCQRNVD
jgi:CheY-like chemotaxis protein